jgi:hypothetical protein
MWRKVNGAIPAEYLAKFEHVPSDLVSGAQDSDTSITPNTKAALSASIKALTSELQAAPRNATMHEPRWQGPNFVVRA